MTVSIDHMTVSIYRSPDHDYRSPDQTIDHMTVSIYIVHIRTYMYMSEQCAYMSKYVLI